MKQLISLILGARTAPFQPILVAVLAGSSALACGPSLDADRVLTPDERLDEQERLAYEAEQKNKNSGGGSQVELTEEDETKAFDQKQAKMELRRASLSAVTCVDVVQDKGKPKGEGEVNITFSHDGSVKDASINPPFAGSALEECVLNAYRAVIVPPFKEQESNMTWKVDLTGKKRDLMKEKEEEIAFPGAKEEEKAEEPKDEKKGSKKKK
jgi:hypothetical protein